eukprot:1527924-Pyramimonas_sp.AAC.1
MIYIILDIAHNAAPRAVAREFVDDLRARVKDCQINFKAVPRRLTRWCRRAWIQSWRHQESRPYSRTAISPRRSSFSTSKARP